MVRLVVLFLAIWLLPVTVFADEEFREIKRLKDIDPSIIEEAEEAAGGFLKADDKIMKEAQDLANTAKDISKDALRGRSRDLREVYSDLKLPKHEGKDEEKKVCGQADGEFKDTYLYFYSHSMPHLSIKEALRTILNNNKKCGKQAVLVVNGFIENNFLKTMTVMHKIIEELGVLADDLPIQMNPDLFARYDVRQVPEMVIEVKGVTGRIKGDISVGYMIEALERGISDYGKYGNLYEVKEQSVVEFMKVKIAEALEDFKRKAPEIARKAMMLSKYDGRFEKAKEDKISYVNPAIILTEDITDHNGRVLFPAGTIADPTEHISLQGKYLIIDGNDASQVEYAKEGVFQRIMIASGDASQVMKKIGKRVYFINDLLIQRFNISRLPSIVEQEGRLIRVTEKAL